MELVYAVGSVFGIGAGAAAPVAAGVAGGSSLLKTIVQGGLTAFSAAASIAGGVAGLVGLGGHRGSGKDKTEGGR